MSIQPNISREAVTIQETNDIITQLQLSSSDYNILEFDKSVDNRANLEGVNKLQQSGERIRASVDNSKRTTLLLSCRCCGCFQHYHHVCIFVE